MKKLSNLFSIILFGVLILTACSTPATQPAAPAAVESTATQAPAPQSDNTAAATATAPAVAQPTTDAAAVQHAATPGTPPDSGGKKWGDHSTISTINAARALQGDQFTKGKFERPYNTNTMDVYFPQLDIDRAVIYPDDATWVYAVISMVGRDSNNAFTGQYAIELDTDRDGRGDFLITADHPASTDWTTQGVAVYADTNNDVGGVDPVVADSAGGSGNGFETVLFDQGKGDDADLAWVRLDPNNTGSFQIAFKQSLLAGETKYNAAIWAGTHLDPAMFDYNDHFTLEQAGSADSSVVNFYPIKALSELDNTCHQAIGYNAKGTEPGICAP